MAFEKLEQEKQLAILNAACEVFAKHGYRKASMRDIADAAQVSKSVLFKYFSTKENLYLRLFRLASDSILEADALARAQGSAEDDVFSILRSNAKSRLTLFRQYPWIYRFSYAAAFDPDPFVQDLVRQELAHYPSAQSGSSAARLSLYRTLRSDISPETASQLVYWVSQGIWNRCCIKIASTRKRWNKGSRAGLMCWKRFFERIDSRQIYRQKDRQTICLSKAGRNKDKRIGKRNV